jgi:hypothetical protein
MEYPALRFSKHIKSWAFLVNQITQRGLHLVTYQPITRDYSATMYALWCPPPSTR